MKKIFAFCNQKGGVGKTTSAVNLASLVAQKGYKVLLLDMDSQGNATSGLGLDKKEQESTSYQLFVDNSDPIKLVKETEFENLYMITANTHLAAADLELVGMERREYVLQDALAKLRDTFDYIFIDCPPSLGLITLNCLVASDYITIPLQCEYYALEGLGQLLHTYWLVQHNLNSELEIAGVILTMADFRTNLTQQVIEEVKEYFKEKVFGSIIPRSVKLSEAPSFGKPAVLYDRYNKASQAYEVLASEFLERFPAVSAGAEHPVKNESASQEETHEESSR